MDKAYDLMFSRLNKAQKQAVDTIEGPLLVVAGPGTGKTQLLSLRVANIINKTDTAPSNVLCLTFTDNASRNMRERLISIMGQSAYHVAIHTFHSFGSEIINRHPDNFNERQLLQQIDELGRYQLLKDIFENLPHSNPLAVKVGDDYIHLKNSLEAISWLRQNAITPTQLSEILSSNKHFMEKLKDLLADTFIESPSPKYLAKYIQLLEAIRNSQTNQTFFGFKQYAIECANTLEQAINETKPDGRFAPQITAWRNSWCQKNSLNKHIFKDDGISLVKMEALVSVYQSLLNDMSRQGLYDFDDMIMEVVQALENQPDLRYSLQEQYQYILVDEFQDTNKAQLRLLYCLGDNPIHEQRPNIMAVGDDDQAIYSFQGAEVSNMVELVSAYKDTKIINLNDNYRSTKDIVIASSAISSQITNRLESIIESTHKNITAVNEFKRHDLKHYNFSSELAQYDWLAEQIEHQIKAGTKAEEIAVIAPRHRYLERLMTFLAKRHLPVAYERRENILEAPIILELITMTKLICAIANNDQRQVDVLLSQILGYDFWQMDNQQLLEISLDCYDKNQHWLPTVLIHKDSHIKQIGEWFNALSKRSHTEPLEYLLDELIGGISDGIDNEYDNLMLSTNNKTKFQSPLKHFYFNQERYEQSTDSYLSLLGQLSTLRQRLRQWKPNKAIYAEDLVNFYELHMSAGLKIIDTNPHTQSTSAVQVMTAYKAKGLEFEVVFVINLQDEVWGPTSRTRSSTIRLPRNLPIAPISDSDNDKLRLFYVALSRAKHSLYLTSYTYDLANKLSPILSFIGDNDDLIDESFKATQVNNPSTPESIAILSTDWAYRFMQILADKPTLFEPILSSYKLSVTHLNNFIDIVDAGPQYFLMHNLLRFPEGISPSAAYGDAIHKTLQWLHAELRQKGSLPKIKAYSEYFSDILWRKHLREADYKRLNNRGLKALEFYLLKPDLKISTNDLIERGFNNEGVVIEGAQLSGKIDKLQFIESGIVNVIDFKTGKPSISWQAKDEYERIKLHKYRQQLLFYKLLVEHSASFSRKLTVTSGELEFIEPDENGQLVKNLNLAFNNEELTDFVKLIVAVWQHISSLNFPDTSTYPPNLKGILSFESDLINGEI